MAFLIALRNENKILGFGLAIVSWLFFAVIYDGLFLLLLMFFRDYSLDTFSLVFSILNPIDLSRIMILLNLDISALMGYTGAVFEKFFGTNTGFLISFFALIMWVLLPMTGLWRVSLRKDF